MSGLSGRERIMISLVVAAVIGVVFYLFVWTPQTAQRASLEQTLQQRLAEVQRLERLAETREEREREYRALADRIRLIEVRLPPEREIPNLIRQLQATAQDLGVKMNLLRPGDTQPAPGTPTGGGATPAGQPAATPPAGVAVAAPAPGPAPPAQPAYQLFRLDLAFEGTYSGLMALLARLEDFPRFIVLKQISLAPGELPVLRATISAETFILPREGSPVP
jgi:Tfp pilus assembly protein PilO